LFLDFFQDLTRKKKHASLSNNWSGILGGKKARWDVWKKKKKIEHGLFADCLIKPPVG